MIGDIHYLNSGDWVESLTALVENYDNEWEIINYADWLKERLSQIFTAIENKQTKITN